MSVVGEPISQNKRDVYTGASVCQYRWFVLDLWSFVRVSVHPWTKFVEWLTERLRLPFAS